MHDAFPHDLHGQRWHDKSAFDQHKRRLGSALTACSDPAQARGMLQRVTTRNIASIANDA